MTHPPAVITRRVDPVARARLDALVRNELRRNGLDPQTLQPLAPQQPAPKAG